MMRSVQNVAKNAKYLFSLQKADRYTAGSATDQNADSKVSVY